MSVAGIFSWIPKLACPSIAAVQGHAYGAGLQLAMACDFRVFGENSKVGLTETRYGILPDMGATSDCPESLAKAELAVRLAGQPPLAIHGTRRAIDAAWFLDPDDSFALAVERRSAAWSPRTSRSEPSDGGGPHVGMGGALGPGRTRGNSI